MNIPDEVWPILKRMTKHVASRFQDSYRQDFHEMESCGLYQGYLAYCRLAKQGRLTNWEPYCFRAITYAIIDANDYTHYYVDKMQDFGNGDVVAFSRPNQMIQVTPENEVDMLDWVSKKLTPQEFDVVYKHFYGKMSIQDIADSCGKTHSQINWLLNRAKVKLGPSTKPPTKKRRKRLCVQP